MYRHEHEGIEPRPLVKVMHDTCVRHFEQTPEHPAGIFKGKGIDELNRICSFKCP